MICANTRTPEVTWGDIRAQINTNTYGTFQVRRAVRQARRRQGAQRAGSAGWTFARPSCARRSPRFPTAATARRPIISTTTASSWQSRTASRPRWRVKGDTLALHPRQRRAGARADQPASLRVAQLHRMPGEDDLHPAFAGERWAVAAGEGVLSAGRLAAQSAVPGAGEHVCAAEPGHDLGGDARRWRARCRAACRRRAAPPAARSAARAAIRRPGAGIRNTRS